MLLITRGIFEDYLNLSGVTNIFGNIRTNVKKDETLGA